MKKNLSKTTSRSNKQRVLEVTPEQYETDIQRGLTDDETLRPGKYLVRRGRFFDNHPELKAIQRTPKARVTIQLDQDIVDAFKQAAATENALPYQTQINQALRQYLENQNAAVSLADSPSIKTLARAIAQEMSKINARQKKPAGSKG